MAVNNINGLNGQTAPRTNEGGKVSVTRGNEAQSQKGAEGAAAAASSDSVSLTDTAARLRSLESSLAEMPEVDNERVAAIQQAIEDGSYEINAASIADKLLNFEASFGE
jgi:negative regulator of flagellin synthesis FlgM